MGLSSAISAECFSGVQSGVAHKVSVGTSGLSWTVSHPSTHVCLQAEDTAAPLLLQLREVLFLWGILDP